MDESVRPRRFPFASIAWLFLTSVLYVVLQDSATGMLSGAKARWLMFNPTLALAEPWRFALAPTTILFSHDAVQFAYVTLILCLFVPWHEALYGWRRTALIFVTCGVLAPILVTLVIFEPLHMFMPDSGIVTLAVSRSYSGGSAGVFAVAGALAATLPARRWAVGVAALALGYETLNWAFYYNWSQLIPIFHYSAFLMGFLIARSAWYQQVRGPTVA